MSGFQSSRIVGLTEFQTTHMSCGICIEIMNKPVETQCRHTFCKFCIDEWLKKKKSCPECRQQLGTKRKRSSDVEYYSETSKKYNDMFNVLDIRCEFEGCHQIIKLENIEKHSEECDFNKCNDCGLRMGKKSEHNCIELLKKVLDNYEKLYKRANGVNIELNKTLAEERKKVSETEKQLKEKNEINSKTEEKDLKLIELELDLKITNEEKCKTIETNKRITEENIDLNKTLTEERNKVLEKENEMTVKMNEIYGLNELNKQLEKSNHEMMQRVIDLQNNNQKLVTEKGVITEEMNRLKDIENKLQTLECDNYRLKYIETIYNLSKQTENEMNGKITEMKNEIKKLKLENQRVMELNKRFEKNMKELEQKLNESKNEYQSLI